MKKFVSRKIRLIPIPRATFARIHPGRRSSNAPCPSLPVQRAIPASAPAMRKRGPDTAKDRNLLMASSRLCLSAPARTSFLPTQAVEGSAMEDPQYPEGSCPSGRHAFRHRAKTSAACACLWQRAYDASPDSAPGWQRSAAKHERSPQSGFHLQCSPALPGSRSPES